MSETDRVGFRISGEMGRAYATDYKAKKGLGSVPAWRDHTWLF
jgi:hypothetical protein